MWLKFGAISGASAVALGAIGAHAILKKDDYMKDTWKVLINNYTNPYIIIKSLTYLLYL